MIKKNYYSGNEKCRVWFYMPSEANAKTAHLVGDFNQWDTQSHPLKEKKDGTFYIALTLDVGKSYQFRYLLDGERWENDWEADQYVPNELGTENSVVNV